MSRGVKLGTFYRLSTSFLDRSRVVMKKLEGIEKKEKEEAQDNWSRTENEINLCGNKLVT